MAYMKFGWHETAPDLFMPIKLNQPIQRGIEPEFGDMYNITTGLDAVGAYDMKRHGRPPTEPENLFQSIERFQGDQGLKVDGLINPRGPTLARLNEVLPAKLPRPEFPNPLSPTDSNKAGGATLADVFKERARQGLSPVISSSPDDPWSVGKVIAPARQPHDPNNPQFYTPTGSTIEEIFKERRRQGLSPVISSSSDDPWSVRPATALSAQQIGQVDSARLPFNEKQLNRDVREHDQRDEQSRARRIARSEVYLRELPPPSNGPIDVNGLYSILRFDRNGPSLAQASLRNPPLASLMGVSGLVLRQRIHAMVESRLGRIDDMDVDAIRHALWNFRLVRSGHDPETVRELMDAYERSNIPQYSNPSLWHGDRLMDLYNNHVGRALALDPRNHDRNDLDVIIAAWRSGRLQRRPFHLPGNG